MSATGDPAAGFTLLETLTALALAAMIGAIGFPMLQRSIDSAVMAQAKAEISADLAVARAEATRRGQPVAVAVAGDGTGYASSLGDARRLPPSARLREAGARLIFYPDGSARAGALTLLAGSRAATLAVSPTGLAAAWR
jgi:type II secretory pathway pseudopilin PulG